MYNSKDSRGLGITKVKDTNFAFLSKWLWRYHHEENSMWKKIIEAKYLKRFCVVFPKELKNSTAKAPWRSILKVKDWFETKFKWVINNGENLLFGTLNGMKTYLCQINIQGSLIYLTTNMPLLRVCSTQFLMIGCF